MMDVLKDLYSLCEYAGRCDGRNIHTVNCELDIRTRVPTYCEKIQRHINYRLAAKPMVKERNFGIDPKRILANAFPRSNNGTHT